MEMMVIPNIKDENDREIALDEMPQSASGKTIMTTEPKFIPKEGVEIRVDDEIDMRVRLIDCVGYVVDGAEGQMEDGKERMVKTPWFDYDIPFAKAAEIGCKDTHFITPNGLDAKDAEGVHSTTAKDLAKIMRYCIMISTEKETFLEVTRAKEYQFQDTERNGHFPVIIIMHFWI